MRINRLVPHLLPALLFGILPLHSQPGASKAVWEPLNYPKDINILDIFFVDESTGWISGGHSIKNGILMKTTDGGSNWVLQVGDPDGEERDFSQLRFIDATHGWAVQRTSLDANLFATRDGEQWELVGKLAEHFDDICFTTRSDGFYADDDRIFATHDGGSTWGEVLQATVQAEVQGLARSVKVNINSLSFPTPADGYAVGGSYDAPDQVFVFRTQDGGETWTHVVAAIGSGVDALVYFTDPSTGFLRLRGGNIFATTDGGESWRGVPGTLGPRLRFADPEVGWSFHYRKFSYSTDGGKRWNSREVQFPQPVQAFSLPNRSLAYVAGDHGMIYRYRAAAGADASKRAIPAPAMPPLTADVEPTAEELVGEVGELSESLGKAGEPEGATSTGTKLVETASAIPFVERCCKTELTQIATLIENLVRDTPQIIGKYRNLNLVSLGLNLVVELPAQLEGIRSAFADLKKAPDARSALSASASLAKAVDAFRSTLAGDSEPAAADPAE